MFCQTLIVILNNKGAKTGRDEGAMGNRCHDPIKMPWKPNFWKHGLRLWRSPAAADRNRREVLFLGLKARNVIAWAEGPGTRPALHFQALKGRPKSSNLFPRISFIQRFAVLFAKPPVLSFKIFLLMMLRLITNVFPHGLNMHRADAKFSITGLPREIGIP